MAMFKGFPNGGADVIARQAVRDFDAAGKDIEAGKLPRNEA